MPVVVTIMTTNVWIVNQSKPTFLENLFLNLSPYIYRYLASLYLLIFPGSIEIEGHRFTFAGPNWFYGQHNLVVGTQQKQWRGRRRRR